MCRPGEYQSYMAAIRPYYGDGSNPGRLVRCGRGRSSRLLSTRPGQVYTGVRAERLPRATGSMISSADQLGDAHKRNLENAERESSHTGQRIIITWAGCRTVYPSSGSLTPSASTLSGRYQTGPRRRFRQFEIRNQVRSGTLAQESGVAF